MALFAGNGYKPENGYYQEKEGEDYLVGILYYYCPANAVSLFLSKWLNVGGTTNSPYRGVFQFILEGSLLRDD
ncbi:MAG: hypothetical protein Q8914_00375 [Bacteroidota bacterium]|nr:hypothetical protein [Bacteroidota bacterium]